MMVPADDRGRGTARKRPGWAAATKHGVGDERRGIVASQGCRRCRLIVIGQVIRLFENSITSCLHNCCDLSARLS